MDAHIIIAFTGPACVGKSTAANIAQEMLNHCGWTATTIPLAKAVKDVARSMGWKGQKDAKGRRLLQLIGTECMRECIDPEGWVKIFEREADEFFSRAGRRAVVLIDDMRFPNEVAMVRRRCGEIIRLRAAPETLAERGGLYGEAKAHASEVGIEECDHLIVNDGTKADLVDSVGAILHHIQNGA
jgi:hypothetical protein